MIVGTGEEVINSFIFSRCAGSLMALYDIIRLLSARFTPTEPPAFIRGRIFRYAAYQDPEPMNCAAAISGMHPEIFFIELYTASDSAGVSPSLVKGANDARARL